MHFIHIPGKRGRGEDKKDTSVEILRWALSSGHILENFTWAAFAPPSLAEFENAPAESAQIRGATGSTKNTHYAVATRFAMCTSPVAESSFEKWLQPVNEYFRKQASGYYADNASAVRSYFLEIWADAQPKGIEL